MRKFWLVLTVMLLSTTGIFAQVTDAPDQNEPATMQNDKPAVTEEKEVVASSGLVYSDGKVNYVAPGVRFQITATDSGSGVKHIWVVVDNAAFGVYTHAVNVPEEGRHIIAYKVEDQVGNVSPVKNYEFTVDATAPEVSVRTLDKGVKLGDTLYISVSNRLELKAIDELSGVKTVEYSFDGGNWKTYSEPIASGLSNGFHKLQYKATDQVGNTSQIKSFMVFVDNSAPTAGIEVTPTLVKVGEKNYAGKDSRFILTAQDKETSVEVIIYSVDNSDVAEYSEPLRLPNGIHTIKVQAVDLLGNVSPEVSLTVEVDGDDPSANLTPAK